MKTVLYSVLSLCPFINAAFVTRKHLLQCYNQTRSLSSPIIQLHPHTSFLNAMCIIQYYNHFHFVSFTQWFTISLNKPHLVKPPSCPFHLWDCQLDCLFLSLALCFSSLLVQNGSSLSCLSSNHWFSSPYHLLYCLFWGGEHRARKWLHWWWYLCQQTTEKRFISTVKSFIFWALKILLHEYLNFWFRCELLYKEYELYNH